MKLFASLSATACVGPGAHCAQGLTRTLTGSVMFRLVQELKGLQLCACDTCNAHLHAKTREKLCIIAGPELGELKGHTLVMFKACHGARTSDNCFAEKLADDLRDMGFFQSQVDSAIWMRDCCLLYTSPSPRD